jgi:general secretion pathway protein I
MRAKSSKTTGRNMQTGFTLIEVMVALVIAAVSLIALSTTLGQYVFNQSTIKERVIATWVAQNRLLELQNTSSGSLEKKKSETMLGADWQTEFELNQTLIPGLKKVKISVTLDGGKYSIAEVSSIVGN